MALYRLFSRSKIQIHLGLLKYKLYIILVVYYIIFCQKEYIFFRNPQASQEHALAEILVMKRFQLKKTENYSLSNR